MSTNMEERPASDSEQIDPPGYLMRQQLKELEQKGKTCGQKILDFVIMVPPVICGFIAIIEYWKAPNGSPNNHPYTYVRVVAAFMTAYVLYAFEAGIKNRGEDKQAVEDPRYHVPLVSASFLLFTAYNYLTLKTDILSQPSVPCINSILSIAWENRAHLLKCTPRALRLLFLGYFTSIALGLVTGITYGCFEKARYWINPIIKLLGSIPTATWTPVIMVVAISLLRDAVFIIAFGSRSAITVASMSGIQNVDKDLFEAVRILGMSEWQLVFRVAIPYVVPSILQDYAQAISSSRITIMIAEVMGVKAGPGWYTNWARSWVVYDKIFVVLFVIRSIFTIATKVLDLVKRHVLR